MRDRRKLRTSEPCQKVGRRSMRGTQADQRREGNACGDRKATLKKPSCPERWLHCAPEAGVKQRSIFGHGAADAGSAGMAATAGFRSKILWLCTSRRTVARHPPSSVRHWIAGRDEQQLPAGRLGRSVYDGQSGPGVDCALALPLLMGSGGAAFYSAGINRVINREAS